MGLSDSMEPHGIGLEHQGSVIEQPEIEEEALEEEMPEEEEEEEEERGGPAEELEEDVVREEDPPKTVKIGSTLTSKHKAALQKPQPAQHANFTDEQPQAEDHLFMATQACYSASKDVWYVDSGCTSHMARDSSLFTSLDKTDRTKVKLGNGEMGKVTGRGTFSIHTSKDPKLIHDVLLIPDLDQNLLSVTQLLKKGYSPKAEQAV
ncbi:hypothetical protein LWI29_008332 [Acer saccharum]|uniref:Retrovirus-related Pol polyprotein from transposon TNT 1-94-like beta-barrel domain-containing protein n=1 Tax=Acer saccharum TaxID=4024 RepID=A0AA39V771_ACESA|nr:hypothetical protein LWI29_008332 [Acer saccharum]